MRVGRLGVLAVAALYLVAGLAVRAVADSPGTVCPLYCDLHLDSDCAAPPGGVLQLGSVSFTEKNHACPSPSGVRCPHCAAIRAAADEAAKAPLPDGPHVIGGALYQTQDGVSYYVADVVPVAKSDVQTALEAATDPVTGQVSATPVAPAGAGAVKVGP